MSRGGFVLVENTQQKFVINVILITMTTKYSIFEKLERIFLIFVLLAFSFSLIALLAQTKTNSNENESDTVSQLNFSKPAKLGQTQIWIAQARTSKERTVGLSGQKGIFENQGLLFAFSEPGIYKIWMKDMLFSLDAIWLDEEYKVIHIEKNITPESFPQTYTSPLPALYILEVRSGFVDSNKIIIGDIFRFL
ncbi:MAG: hypothetical protein CO184_02070 [Candidatus Zambryskibacteria bacterium CG_4_9_14_3_um_filter_40_16]|uniref:DUF192 domain-containing protein n=2 Tax=Candidatus Zambryskiibacteriota TaxID=1817925 RepID=A0A2H0K6U2_9BACT|nr:MAG: hypothetical protein COV95_01250 [Candidatus Zambryskibacteria bacterium CG11_big_fil_rev_8_21_14_0_20_40_24]PJA33422.1 MAG: hypothetical protein CO184_02070 [Candidatus Zambryskibacteria bacterium CG_4_9_14_3_um_filter_40_16]